MRLLLWRNLKNDVRKVNYALKYSLDKGILKREQTKHNPFFYPPRVGFTQSGTKYVTRTRLQGGWGGWPTGNGNKLSNSPACCLTQLCLAAVYILSISCRPSTPSALYNIYCLLFSSHLFDDAFSEVWNLVICMRVDPIPIPNPQVDFGRLRSDFVVGTHNGCGAAASTMPYSATSLTGPAVEDETRRTCVTNGFPPLIPIQIWVESCIKLHLYTDKCANNLRCLFMNRGAFFMVQRIMVQPPYWFNCLPVPSYNTIPTLSE